MFPYEYSYTNTVALLVQIELTVYLYSKVALFGTTVHNEFMLMNFYDIYC